MQDATPVSWITRVLAALQWPVLVAGAFCLGRYVRGLEMRLLKAETNLQQIMERHLPAIHRALAEIRGLLMGRAK